MFRIYIVQHCQSEHHINEYTGGWTDTPLTASGKTQALSVAKELKRFGLTNFKLISSDLKRAYMTAEFIAKEFNTTIIKDKLLREHNNGLAAWKTVEWANQNKNELTQEELIDSPLWQGAETFRDLFNRMSKFIDDNLLDLQEDIVIVSHGVAIGYLIMSWLGLNAEDLSKSAVRGNAGGISVLTVSKYGQHTLYKYNNTSHI